MKKFTIKKDTKKKTFKVNASKQRLEKKEEDGVPWLRKRVSFGKWVRGGSNLKELRESGTYVVKFRN